MSKSTLEGGESNGRFPDYIHEQRVNLLCSLAKTSRSTQTCRAIRTHTNTHTHTQWQWTPVHLDVVLILWGVRHLHRAPSSCTRGLVLLRPVIYCCAHAVRGSKCKQSIKQMDDTAVKMLRTKGYLVLTTAPRAASPSPADSRRPQTLPSFSFFITPSVVLTLHKASVSLQKHRAGTR